MAKLALAIVVLVLTSFGAWAADWSECKSDDPDRAIQGCTRLLSSGTGLSAPDRAMALYDRGRAYYQKGDYDRAIADYSEAIRFKPDYIVALYGRGLAYYQRGDHDRAIADYNEAIRLKPDNPDALINRGNAYADKGEYDRAIADYNEAIRLKPDYALALTNRGLAYEAKGDKRGALDDFERALALKSDLAAARDGRERVLSALAAAARPSPTPTPTITAKPEPSPTPPVAAATPTPVGPADWSVCNSLDADRAIQDCTRLLALGAGLSTPDRAKALYYRGIAYAKGEKGDYDRAIADYSEALRLEPDDPNTLRNRGFCYEYKRDYDRAILDFNEVLRLRPDDAEALESRGGAYDAKGDYDRAIADLNEALRLIPDYTDALTERGYAYEGKGDHDRAIADFNEALRLKPNYTSDALKGRGDAFEGKGDYDRAIADYTRALRLDPKNKEALNNRGGAYLAMKKFDEAIRDLDDAIAMDAQLAKSRALRARAYLGKHDVPRAGADAEEAIRLDPKYSVGYLARGEIREKSGDNRGALDDFERALALKNDSTLKNDVAAASDGRERILSALTAAAQPTPTPAPTPTVAAKPEPSPTPTPVTQTARRVALVIANGAYRDAALNNPSTDAKLVAASLQKVGFTVTVKENLALDEFEEALAEFGETTRGADVALFYFAGHGFSISTGGRQQNLLMATNADFHAKTAIALQGGGEPLEHVEEMIIGHARATLLFIDACREVPAFAVRGRGDRGFAAFDISAFDGAFVVLSTRQGRTAEDGPEGRGSPFARAFAAILPTPKLRIEDAYARMREMVRAESSGAQIPDAIRSDLPEGGVVLMSGGQ